MGEQKGRSKKRKTSQPKRQRYNAQRRGWRRALRNLETHIAKHPEDQVAKDSLPEAKKLAFG